MEKKTKTRGNVIVENIKVGDIHYEYDLGLGIKCEVITLPKLKEGMWSWQSKNVNTEEIIDYSISDVNSENYSFSQQFGVKLFDYEAYKHRVDPDNQPW